MNLDIAVYDDFGDIVAEGFDAGIRFGGSIAEEMIAVPIGGDDCWIMVASSGHLANAKALTQPADLASHRCIGIRMGTWGIYHWELEQNAEQIAST